jgi:hypothetical protein
MSGTMSSTMSSTPTMNDYRHMCRRLPNQNCAPRKPASINYFCFAVCCGVRSSTLGHNLALDFWVT